MEFNSRKAIYHQISDLICENILREKFLEEGRLDSVRDMAVELEVNPNTVMRAYKFLQDSNIIYNKRGVGYFISTGAKELVLTMKKGSFIEDELPGLFREAELYNIKPDELNRLYIDYLKGVKSED